MKVAKICLKDGEIRYSYKYTDIKNFLEHGFKNGNNGLVLLSIKDGFLKYRGFGTIENPSKRIFTVRVQHDYTMYGPLVLYDYCEKSSLTSHRLEIINFSKHES